jgi:hypothetical protein
MAKICICKFDYSLGIGVGICRVCGGETCTMIGCFISNPDHNCGNPRFMNFGGGKKFVKKS